MLGLYLLIAFFGEIAQDRPVYGNHLGFEPHKGYNYTTFVNVTALDDWQLAKFNECVEYFGWPDSPKELIPNDVTNMWISIGSLFGILIVTHVVVAGISNWKSKRYFEKEAER